MTPANTTSEDFSEFAGAGVLSMMFNIGVYEPERWTADITMERRGQATIRRNLRRCQKPTIAAGIKAMTLAVPGAFDQHAHDK